ncbi:MAG: hypothetical protein JXA28_03680 [Bacteroidetes bacterium]|nr:hypothetical protein [Bacteroidota bacterium]
MNRPTLRERLRYRSDQFFQSGFTLQLFISSLIIFAVAMGFYLLVELFQINPGSEFGGEGASGEGPLWPSGRLWWVVTHMLETYWFETTTFSQILSTLLTLFNFLVFAAIIGLVGSRIQQRLEQVRRGTSRVIEEDHIVILGWSGKVIPIIRELSEGLEGGRQVYVIHTERPIDEIETRMRKNCRKDRSVRWVIRQGSMTDIRDLEILAIERARVVIILQRDQGVERGDAQVIKTVMAAAHIIEQNPGVPGATPVMIAEIIHPSMVRLTRAAARSVPISIIQPLEHLSRIILQTARQQGLVDVYDEILSHHSNEVHLLPADVLTGRSWEETVFSFRAAIPIGILRDGIPHLAPQHWRSAFTVTDRDVIIALARNEGAMRISAPVIPSSPAPPTGAHDEVQRSVRNLLLLGWNDKVYPLLKEYAGYARTAGSQFSVTLVSPGIPADLRAGEVAAIIDSGSELKISIARVDYLRAGVYEDLEPARFDAVIVLGDTFTNAQIEDADTRVIMTLLLLRSLREQGGNGVASILPGQQIVGEILNVSNKALAESTGTVRDVIISNDLVSRIIAQVCRDRRIEMIIRDFLDEEGMEIYFKSVLRYAPDGEELTFDQLLLAALHQGESAIGYCTETSGGPRRIVLNPDRQLTLRIGEELSLIVIASGEEGAV